ncbi:MAG: carbohydrate ABC transporter permease [Limnochordia bacterium]|jgi:ABC-type glycerol-3-phosphate transport system permease component|nr:carbohydrate ABC transporter permease [Bacillota bacterium]HKM16992.1 carbohydrate ABC transporter permease [Limnochordia bacterium]NLH31913.1 carbohydrate ABC transporter permease [Bacillota bacterium]HOB09730.1 carbohydrate ABC transporter permease [Limnochordia bacterium]HPZ31659.1 carbohydrate ABC transporter permease [Limnochordia bacterium]
MRLQLREKRITRSTGGDLLVFLILVAGGAFMSLPMVYTIFHAFKPMNELFIWPPQFFVRNPTLANFYDLFLLMEESWVPFTRYLYNTLLITVLGTSGHVLMASLAAYALAKHRFPGQRIYFNAIVFSLMFAWQVTAIPNYLTMSRIGWVDTYMAIIAPAWAMPLGLYLMKQFMEQIPDALLEAARIDGASEFRIFWKIVMPNVKPAWLTLIIISFQSMWGETGARFIYTEALKPLPYALNQIVSAGIARAGVGAAVLVLMMVVPIALFVFNQSKVVQTMGSAGIDK